AEVAVEGLDAAGEAGAVVVGAEGRDQERRRHGDSRISRAWAFRARSSAGAGGGGSRGGAAKRRWASTERRARWGRPARPTRPPPGRGDDEVADAPPLELGRPSHHGQCVGGDPRLDPRGPIRPRSSGHPQALLDPMIVYGEFPDKSRCPDRNRKSPRTRPPFI